MPYIRSYGLYVGTDKLMIPHAYVLPMDLKRYLGPALVLFILSPCIAELLSGSSPPLVFFNPVLLVLQLALYGSGAILVRELVFRWKKGWPSILLLGAAYGLVEEGLALKSVYNPTYPGVNPTFGRWIGVNWVWTTGMITYHAVISIAIPVLLVMLIFPKKQAEPWARDRILLFFVVLLLSAVVILNQFIAPYSPPLWLYAMTLMMIACLALAAKMAPLTLPRSKNAIVVNQWWLMVFGFVWTLLLYVTIFVPSLIRLPWPVGILIMLIFYALSVMALRSMSDSNGSLSDKKKLMLALGILMPFIILSPVRELLGARGMLVVGISAVVFFIYMYKRIFSVKSTS
jgi:hypothetical protein